MGLPAVPLDGQRAGAYQRHRPETTTLYAVVRDNVETLYAAVAAGFEGAALPPFVRREFDSYLACGLLCRGFARMKCDACDEQHLVAFSCNAIKRYFRKRMSLMLPTKPRRVILVLLPHAKGATGRGREASEVSLPITLH